MRVLELKRAPEVVAERQARALAWKQTSEMSSRVGWEYQVDVEDIIPSRPITSADMHELAGLDTSGRMMLDETITFVPTVIKDPDMPLPSDLPQPRPRSSLPPAPPIPLSSLFLVRRRDQQ